MVNLNFYFYLAIMRLNLLFLRQNDVRKIHLKQKVSISSIVSQHNTQNILAATKNHDRRNKENFNLNEKIQSTPTPHSF